MSNKYNGRNQSVISRNADENIDEDHWLNQFQKNLQKGAVQPKPIDNFLFDQINHIMNNKSKYPSVAAAVEDMKERSGLAAFLAKTSNEDTSNSKTATNEKTASDNNDVIEKKIPMGKKLPLVIIKCPQISSTIENIIRSSRGNLAIPAIIDRVRSIHQNDVSEAKDWEEPAFIGYIAQENLKAKQISPGKEIDSSNLGSRNDAATDDIDAANSDAFSALVPAKY